MLLKAIGALSALAAVQAMLDFEPAGDGTYNILLDGVRVEDLVSAGQGNDTAPAWQCDIRAWTRAPDLSPGKVFPADARLAANGSACGDIVKWEVGMRLKERALIKMRAKGVEFPTEPIRPVWNESFYMQHDYDYNDILGAGSYRSLQDPAEKEWEDAMDVYREWCSATSAVRNASLWLISGQERVVYDLTREMDLKGAAGIELTEAFAIHMPQTNFPPIERYSELSGGSGDDQMLVTETLSEFYHLITLANGTALDLPSGEIGIIPAQSPVKSSSSSRGSSSIGDIQWPQSVDFLPTNHTKPSPDGYDYRYGYMQPAPSCDDFNAANFSLRVDSNITQPILGQNITFNLTLTRTGNGSEYPAWIDVAHTNNANITWARQFVDNEEEYKELRNGYGGAQEVRWMWSGPEDKMRRAPSEKQLEEEKREKERDHSMAMCSDGFGGMWGGPMGQVRARYEMWDDEKAPQEVYTFGLEVALPEHDLPSFEKTFETIRSSLTFTLYTYFTCDERNNIWPAESQDTGKDVSNLDREWDHYALPARPPKRHRRIAEQGMTFSHTSMIPLDAALSSTAAASTSTNDEAGVMHYLDEAALAPVLSRSVHDEVRFPVLDQAVREETEDEHKRSRWGVSVNRFRRRGWCQRASASTEMCYVLNGGGGDKLASRMWQSKVAREKEGFDVRTGADEPAGAQGVRDSSFVVQA